MMKKLYYILALLGFTIYSCEPMDDLQDQANEEINSSLTAGEADYTLTEDDYEEVGRTITTGFDNYEQAERLIPVILNTAFPLYQNGTSIITSFNVYDPLRPIEYTVTAEGYEAVGNEAGYFVSSAQVQSFLDYQFNDAQEGDVVTLTYDTVADEIGYEITSADFSLIGTEFADIYPNPASSAAQYNNFDLRQGTDAYWSDAMKIEAINVVLSTVFEGVEGQRYNVSYTTYDGSTGLGSMTVVFDGNNYVSADAEPTSYELTNDDYALAASALAETYPGPADNLSFNSFDTVEGSDNYWSEEMIVEALNIILEENVPSANSGDQFEITYTIYNGSGTSPESMSLIRDGDEFVINNNETPAVSTEENTDTYALSGGSWTMPISLTEEDYTEMGQEYPNFDDEAEALNKISTYLEMRYPYASEDDVVVMEYVFYDGSSNTRYTLFNFQDGEWIGAPQVIENTLQLAKIDGLWVPDNTVQYLLTGADFSTIAEELEDEYPNPVSSMLNYSNFDRRSGESAEWTDEMLTEAMVIVLNDIAPDAEIGQQYVITFDVYNGSNTTESINLIKDEDGDWVRNEE